MSLDFFNISKQTKHVKMRKSILTGNSNQVDHLTTMMVSIYDYDLLDFKSFHSMNQIPTHSFHKFNSNFCRFSKDFHLECFSEFF